jgi:16S rRNA (uracil1498-N3)-methyltransferase
MDENPLRVPRSADLRLFVDVPLASGGLLEPSAAQAHYLLTVMRRRAGDEVVLFNGRDGEWLATIDPVERRRCRLAIVEQLRAQLPEPGPALLFAPLKRVRQEFMIEKATELGVARLVPFEAARSVVRLGGARGAERARRWQRIAVQAARQSGRGDVPTVDAPGPLEAALASCPGSFRKLLFYEGGGEPVASAVDRSAPGHLAVIGPEGGLAPEEVEICLRAGARLVTLGPRVLRFETAGMVAAALLQHLLGDLGQDL